MTKKELEEIFDWLEENMNMRGWFEFKLSDRNQITAYWKGTRETFAQFYINPILKILEGENER